MCAVNELKDVGFRGIRFSIRHGVILHHNGKGVSCFKVSISAKNTEGVIDDQ